MGSMMVGQATAFAPNYNKAVVAAARIFKLLDRQPVIDSSEGSKGIKLVRLNGVLSYRKNDFDRNTKGASLVIPS